MNILRFLIFFTVFSSVYFLMNHIAVRKLTLYSGYPLRGGIFLILVIVLVLAFPLAMMAARNFPGSAARVFYLVSTTAMGITLITLAVVGITELLKWILPSVSRVWEVSALAAVFLLSLIALVQGRNMKTERFHHKLPGLESPVKVVHLSDLHLGMVYNYRSVYRLAEKVNALEADLVVITGDLFDGSRHPEPRCVEGFSKFKAPVYMSSGNHDMYEGLDKVEKVLKGSAIRYLKNESVITHGLEILGVDHPANERSSSAQIPEHLPSRPDLPNILLYHLPSGTDHARARGIDLQLSGHTHYGQIWPFNYLVRIAFPKGFGWVHEDGFSLYTSPGTGTWGPPMRLGSRNTIALIHLEPGSRTP